MSSGRDSAQPPFQPAPVPEEGAPPDESTKTGPSLDDLVRETIDAHGDQSSISPDVWNSLIAVARRHPAQAQADLAIVGELVSAVLNIRIERIRDDAGALAHCARRVAETLWEDGPSRERLERLWSRLQGESP
jgi:hypothetical protein